MECLRNTISEKIKALSADGIYPFTDEGQVIFSEVDEKGGHKAFASIFCKNASDNLEFFNDKAWIANLDGTVEKLPTGTLVAGIRGDDKDFEDGSYIEKAKSAIEALKQAA